MENRAYKSYCIDILRCIGILCIILAHVMPSGSVFFQARTFDVVLMVVISCVSYCEFSNTQIKYSSYLLKRFKRIVIPTWVFIILLGIIFKIIALATHTQTFIPLKTMCIGFVTFSGVGYLWVMRVFAYNATLNPFINKLNEKVSSDTLFFTITGVVYVVYELMCVLLERLTGGFRTIVEVTVFHYIGWGLVALCGIRFYNMRSKKLFIFTIVFAVVIAVICILQKGFLPNDFKYPPRHLYIIYGLLVTSTLFLILRIDKFQCMKQFKSIVYISRNSIWIYFWHVIFIDILTFYKDSLTMIVNIQWGIKYILVVLLSIICVILQNYLIGKVRELFCKWRR